MVGICLQSVLISICTGNLGMFDILQFEITNWNFFLVWKQTGYLYQFKLCFFPSFWGRVKFIPFLQFTEIYITSFWSGGFTTPIAVNQRNENLGNPYLKVLLCCVLSILNYYRLTSSTVLFQLWIKMCTLGGPKSLTKSGYVIASTTPEHLIF